MKAEILNELDRGPRSRRALRKILGLQPGPGSRALLKALRELQASRRVWYSLYDDVWHLDEGYIGPPGTYLG